ncbi:MAG: hypothetical protein KatS3mg105_3950 [Gemmatales bacterium]|nr:MAG: hypothetical protein KatS3mg105_3950 [Gemmatales bacterium]
MIHMPRRSVTRFFIPLVDVLTLMFCVYLLMPVVEPEDGSGFANSPLSSSERAELERLRAQSGDWKQLRLLADSRAKLLKELDELQRQKIRTLQERLAIHVLEIGPKGKLYHYDSTKPNQRQIEITEDNVKEIIRQQRLRAGGQEIYFLILYPRDPEARRRYPTTVQKETYDRWLANEAHGYEVN